MAKLIIDGEQHADRWSHLTDADGLVDRDFSVGLARWCADRDHILEHAQQLGLALGVRLVSASDPLQLQADIDRLDLIVIDVANPVDGRLFSIAARLREHLNYRRELRVSGAIATDQLLFMQRCGINAFELPDQVNITHFKSHYQRFYQSGGPIDTQSNLINAARRVSSPPPKRTPKP